MDGKFEAREFFRQETWGCEIFQTAGLSSVKTGNNGCLFLVLSFQTEIEMCVLSADCLLFSGFSMFNIFLLNIICQSVQAFKFSSNLSFIADYECQAICFGHCFVIFFTLLLTIKIHIICGFNDNLHALVIYYANMTNNDPHNLWLFCQFANSIFLATVSSFLPLIYSIKIDIMYGLPDTFPSLMRWNHLHFSYP